MQKLPNQGGVGLGVPPGECTGHGLPGGKAQAQGAGGMMHAPSLSTPQVSNVTLGPCPAPLTGFGPTSVLLSEALGEVYYPCQRGRVPGGRTRSHPTNCPRTWASISSLWDKQADSFQSPKSLSSITWGRGSPTHPRPPRPWHLVMLSHSVALHASPSRDSGVLPGHGLAWPPQALGDCQAPPTVRPVLQPLQPGWSQCPASPSAFACTFPAAHLLEVSGHPI